MAAQPVNVKQVNVYLTHEQHERLQNLKEKTGAPVSVLIRRAVDAYLEMTELARTASEERRREKSARGK